MARIILWLVTKMTGFFLGLILKKKKTHHLFVVGVAFSIL